MAEYLASIFGTEKDKSAHVDMENNARGCTISLHSARRYCFKTYISLRITMPIRQNVANMTEVQAQEIFDEFFEEVFVECESKYGEIEEMNVCDNLGDHLVGNVYIKFRREEDAEKAVKMLNQRWFGGRPVHAELSPVTDFREACCRQYELGECTRGGFCNFMHLKPISRELCRKLYNRSKRRYGGSSRRRRSRSRSGGHRRSRSPKARGSRR
ncbi:Splicing factor U2AF subunit [Echinococcus granulosus]|uniref:Splicing factor U2AF subunit n=1 Tax=Echinococcus granulosus TaxID=6210 RepID=W6UGS7_ECHGR|nr:Splicing factor U2AF subunit [Echinococcus granulosus]XP_024348518.1 Splicing factor U2AF subunit [Echinococcus granulosus]EUB57312.1 Splicing factor U2AF subunit [Echinococcus granulosus]EUB57322.1 Splicing factor U2AF subunit [Echinococcus granulosus]